jgi:hypothetical protein
MGLLNATGTLTMLRVHERGSRFGPPDDSIDVEVVFTLSTTPDRAIGFQLRDDANRPVRQGMLALLLDAFDHAWTVHTDCEVPDGRKNGIALRVWVTRPQPHPPSTAPLDPGARRERTPG